MGWGNFLDSLLEKLPLQGRVERWQNEFDALIKERKELLKGGWDAKKDKRLTAIDNRINTLTGWLRNKAK